MDSIAISTDAEARQAAALLAAIEAMDATLAVADALAAEHRRIDLAGLEDEVGRICVASLATPRSAAPAVRARLEGLLRRLDHLRAVLAPR
jgi:hypothetical protein